MSCSQRCWHWQEVILHDLYGTHMAPSQILSPAEDHRESELKEGGSTYSGESKK